MIRTVLLNTGSSQNIELSWIWDKYSLFTDGPYRHARGEKREFISQINGDLLRGVYTRAVFITLPPLRPQTSCPLSAATSTSNATFGL